ncbi:MAG TPA: hypothetical protein VM753_23855 [Anaeromyxobacter sp.]|jgi:hypothetical protein|nr:hypothetical protein [Anaeromyxobacter sp.]
MTRRLAIAALLASALTACQLGGDTTRFSVAESCTPVPGACTKDADCCSYGCLAGVCAPNPVPGGVCRTTGDCSYLTDPVLGSNQMICKSGACTRWSPGLLRDNGDVCTADTQCLAGNCAGDVTYLAPGRCQPNHPPVVVLPAELVVSYRKSAVLTPVTVSDPDGDVPLVFGWTLDSAPVGALPVTSLLSSQTIQAPTFTPGLAGAPGVIGDYALKLTVTDGSPPRPNRMSASDTMIVRVQNLKPVVSALADQPHASRHVAQTATATVSDPDGDALTCTWTATGPGQTTLTSGRLPCAADGATTAQTASWTFTLEQEVLWTVTLTVTDTPAASSATPNTVTVTAQYQCVNDPPVANAGPDQVWNLSIAPAANPTVPLHGTMVDPNGDAASSWTWTMLSAPTGSGAVIVNGAAQDASFVPDLVGRYVFQVEVCDRPGSCTPDTANVDVYRPIREFTDGRVVNATDYAHGANKIVLAGPDPAATGKGKLWLYDPAAATEVSASLDAVPDTVAVTPDGTYAVAGNNLFLWVVKLSASPPTVTKVGNTVGTLGSIALVPSRTEAIVFPQTGSGFFARFDYASANATTVLTSCGYYGNLGRTDRTDTYLYVLDISAMNEIARYPIGNQGGFSLGYPTTGSLGYYSGITNLWISQDLTHVFTSNGDIRAVGNLGTAAGSLGVSPAFLDSLLDGQVVASNGSGIALFGTGLTQTGTDVFPPWGISGVGYSVSPDGVFVRTDPSDATKTIRYAVVHTTGAASNRTGLVTFP